MSWETFWKLKSEVRQDISGALNKTYTLRLIALIFIPIIILVYFLGMANGARTATNHLIDLGMQILDVELNPMAENLLKSNPAILTKYFEENVGAENLDITANPFSKHPQASLKYELCIIEQKDADLCYKAGVAKYGISALDNFTIGV